MRWTSSRNKKYKTGFHSPTTMHGENGRASTDGKDDEDFPNDSEYDTAEDDWPKDGGSPAHSTKMKDASAHP
ncbi:hypothetical protein M404DRAFT_378136 [Pisolithus tinctorius Marx 270]|uniref:Uncharacterized protein n=1 Tax=Pisolithus tinctorius Marx 270 TaxID=870435 RepID=A0A0C3PHL4_PISTI|nr:hypothetical protein M404DRAFT_378136 [Pisolithus tinctorius Marx 270]